MRPQFEVLLIAMESISVVWNGSLGPSKLTPSTSDFIRIYLYFYSSWICMSWTWIRLENRGKELRFAVHILLWLRTGSHAESPLWHRLCVSYLWPAFSVSFSFVASFAKPPENWVQAQSIERCILRELVPKLLTVLIMIASLRIPVKPKTNDKRRVTKGGQERATQQGEQKNGAGRKPQDPFESISC